MSGGKPPVQEVVPWSGGAQLSSPHVTRMFLLQTSVWALDLMAVMSGGTMCQAVSKYHLFQNFSSVRLQNPVRTDYEMVIFARTLCSSKKIWSSGTNCWNITAKINVQL